MRCCLIDTLGSGHHWTYNSLVIAGLSEQAGSEILYCSGAKLSSEQKAFLKEKNAAFLEFEYDESKIKAWVQLFRYRVSILKKLFAYCKTENVDKVLFLYADGLMAALSATSLYARKFGVYYFVHWLPVRTRERLLFSLAKCDKVVVHTEYIKERMPALIRSKTETVPYPMAVIDRKQLTVPDENRNRILYFGGTRKDKGVDLLIEALKLVSSKVSVTICGAESYFKKDYIVSELEKCENVFEKRILLRYVSDEEMESEYARAGIVVLPYRKTFRGESGVLLEAINHEKLVIAPDILHFKEYVSEAESGLLYTAEDPARMAEAIDQAVQSYDRVHCPEDCRRFSEKHAAKNFQAKVLEIIK